MQFPTSSLNLGVRYTCGTRRQKKTCCQEGLLNNFSGIRQGDLADIGLKVTDRTSVQSTLATHLGISTLPHHLSSTRSHNPTLPHLPHLRSAVQCCDDRLHVIPRGLAQGEGTQMEASDALLDGIDQPTSG